MVRPIILILNRDHPSRSWILIYLHGQRNLSYLMIKKIYPTSWSKKLIYLHDKTHGLFRVLLCLLLHQAHFSLLLSPLQASEQERKHYHHGRCHMTNWLHCLINIHKSISLTQIPTSQRCAEDPGSSSTRSCSSPQWCWCPPAGSCCGGSSSRCRSASGSQRWCPWTATMSLAFYQQVVPHPARKLDSDQDSGVSVLFYL